MSRTHASNRKCRFGRHRTAVLVGILAVSAVTGGSLAEAQTAPRTVQAVLLTAGSNGHTHVVSAYGAEGTQLRSHHTTSPVIDISVCPQSQYAAILTTQSVEIISIATMRPRGADSRSLVDREVRGRSGTALEHVRCLDAEAGRLLVVGESARSSAVTLVTPQAIEDVWQAGLVSFDVAADGQHVYIAGLGGSLVEIDLAARNSRRLTTDGLPLYGLTLNASGRLIAGVQTTGPDGTGPTHAVVINTVTNSIVTRLEPEPVPTGAPGTTIHWFDDGRLGLRPTGGLLDAYDPSFQLIARAERLFGYPAQNLDVTVYAISGNQVLRTTFGVGGVDVFTTAERELTSFALLDPPVEVELEPPPVPNTPIPVIVPADDNSPPVRDEAVDTARSEPLTGSIGPAIDYETIDAALPVRAPENDTGSNGPWLLLFLALGTVGAAVFVAANRKLSRTRPND